MVWLMLGRAVSTHSRPKAAAHDDGPDALEMLWFQHTAARRRLLNKTAKNGKVYAVSTHSRPKAAAEPQLVNASGAASFNTQPPEGGCRSPFFLSLFNVACFNTQPPEGGCSLHKKVRKIS